MDEKTLAEMGIPAPPWTPRKSGDKPVGMSGEDLVTVEAPLMTGIKTIAQREQEIFAKSFQRIPDMYVHRCECQKCSHVWQTASQIPPIACPKCHNPWWFRERKVGSHPPLAGRANGFGGGKGGKKKPEKPKRGPGRPRKRPSNGGPPNAGWILGPGETIEGQTATTITSLPKGKMAKVGAVGESGVPPVRGRFGRPVKDEKPLLHPAHGDYGLLVSALLASDSDSPVETRQPADAGRVPDAHDPGSSEEPEVPLTPLEAQITRVDPNSVPRTTGTVKPIEAIIQQQPDIDPAKFQIRRVTREELYPEINQPVQIQQSNTVPPPTGLEHVAKLQTLPTPVGNVPRGESDVDPGLARWADDPMPAVED